MGCSKVYFFFFLSSLTAASVATERERECVCVCLPPSDANVGWGQRERERQINKWCLKNPLFLLPLPISPPPQKKTPKIPRNSWLYPICLPKFAGDKLYPSSRWENYQLLYSLKALHKDARFSRVATDVNGPSKFVVSVEISTLRGFFFFFFFLT